MVDPRLPAMPLQVIVLVDGLPAAVIDPATFDEVAIDDIEHMVPATVNTLEVVLRDAFAARHLAVTPPTLRLDPKTCTLIDVARALLEDLPEMATDAALSGADAVDVLCSIWPAMLAALAREVPRPPKPRKRIRVTSSVTMLVDDEVDADMLVRRALAPLVDGLLTNVEIDDVDEVDKDGNTLDEED